MRNSCYFLDGKGKCKLPEELKKKVSNPCPNNTRCLFYINVPPDVLLSHVLKRKLIVKKRSV